jgi:hypothetical protein
LGIGTGGVRKAKLRYSGGARIPNLGIPTYISTKTISCFLTTMSENTIKYGGARPRSYFLLFWVAMSENTVKYSIIHIHI